MPATTLLTLIAVSMGQSPDTLLVSTEWLARRLDEPGLVILHAARDDDAYREGHIPGARFLSDEALTVSTEREIYDVAPVDDLVEAFERVGTSDGSRVVVYGDPFFVGRTFYTLEYLGFTGRVSVLDGGLQKWRAEGRALSTERPRETRGSLTARVENVRLVDADWVQSHLDDETYALVDARPENQFEANHIRGAGNLYFEDALTDDAIPVLKDRESLRRLFAGAGAADGKQVVTYCAIGMRASFLYFAARYAGYEAAMYDGSYHDWRMIRGLPVVSGRP